MSDMLLALWTTLAVALALAGETAAGARRARDRASPSASCSASGFLTKGPIGAAAPGLGIATWAWRRRRLPLPRRRAASLAVAAFAAVGLAWFALVYRRLGAAPLEYFFLRENLERFAGETYDAGRSPVYYLGAYLAVGLPWSLLFPRAAFRLPRGERAILVWLALMARPAEPRPREDRLLPAAAGARGVAGRGALPDRARVERDRPALGADARPPPSPSASSLVPVDDGARAAGMAGPAPRRRSLLALVAWRRGRRPSSRPRAARRPRAWPRRARRRHGRGVPRPRRLVPARLPRRAAERGR